MEKAKPGMEWFSHPVYIPLFGLTSAEGRTKKGDESPAGEWVGSCNL